MPLTILGPPTQIGGGAGGPATQIDASGTVLDVGAVADGEFLRRSGTDIIGSAAVTGPADEIDANGTTLTVDAIADGEMLIRSGTSLTSQAIPVVGPADELDANGTTLTVDAIADGEMLIRSGTSVTSQAIPVVGPADELDANGTTLTVDAIADGEMLIRSGTSVTSQAIPVIGPADEIDANGTTLTIDAIADGEVLIRTGTGIVGATIASIVSEGSVRTALAAATGAIAVNGQNITGAGVVNAALGNAGTPSYAYTGDTDTGTFSPGADRWAVSTGGTQRFEVSTTAITGTLQMSFAGGSAAAPTFSYTGDLDTGAFSPGADAWAVSTGGTQRFDVSTTAITSTLPARGPAGSAGTPTWSFSGDPDTGIAAASANTLTFSAGGTTRMSISSSQWSLTPGAATGSGVPFTINFPASTAQTASTEVIGWRFASGVIVQHNTGALATQRCIVMEAPTYSFVGASTLTSASTLDIDGAPIAGTNATITRSWALTVTGNVRFANSLLIGASGVAPDQTLDVRSEISIFGADASLARLRLRGFYGSSPADPPTSQTDIMVVDTGAAQVLRIRYNDGGTMRVGDVALV